MVLRSEDIPVTEILPTSLDSTVFVNLKIKIYPQKYPQKIKLIGKGRAWRVEKRK